MSYAKNFGLPPKDPALIELNKLRDKLAAAKAVAAEQALDEGLWCIAETAMEGHLQTALRKLAAAVEGDAAIAGSKT